MLPSCQGEFWEGVHCGTAKQVPDCWTFYFTIWTMKAARSPSVTQSTRLKFSPHFIYPNARTCTGACTLAWANSDRYSIRFLFPQARTSTTVHYSQWNTYMHRYRHASIFQHGLSVLWNLPAKHIYECSQSCGFERLLLWIVAVEVMDSESSIQMNSHPRGKFNPPWMFHAQELLCVRLRLSVNIPGMSVCT